MSVVTKEVEIETKGFNDIHDVTSLVNDFVKNYLSPKALLSYLSLVPPVG